MRMLRRSDSQSGPARPPATVCGDGAAGARPGAASDADTVDPTVVATRLSHLLTHLPGAREVLACGSDLSVEFTAELTARGFTVDDDDLAQLLTGAGTDDLAVIAALAAALSVPEHYFFNDAVAAQFDEDLDLLSGWLDYRNSGVYLCGTGTPDNRADLKAFVHRFREIQQHTSSDDRDPVGSRHRSDPPA